MNNRFLRWAAPAALVLSLAGCSSNSTSSQTAASGSGAPTLTPGPWRGVLATQARKFRFHSR